MVRGPLVPLSNVRPKHADPPPATVRRLRPAIEVIVLRHEVAVLRRQEACPALRPSNRALLAGLSQLIPRAKLHQFFVKPHTPLLWYRGLIRRKWSYPKPSGRLKIPKGTVRLVVRFARTRRGVIAGSTGSFPSWASTWHRRASGTSSSVMASTGGCRKSRPYRDQELFPSCCANNNVGNREQ
jgi:hypothetical protein